MPVEFDSDEEEIRTRRPLRRSGNSVVVSLPPELLRAARFEVGDELIVAAGFGGGEIQLRHPSSDRQPSEVTADD